MAFKRKCKICETYITDEIDAVEYKGGYVHTKCFSISLKILQEGRSEKLQEKQKNTSPKSESLRIPKKGLSEVEHKEKTEYYSYIKGILAVDQIPAKIFVITEKQKEQFDYFTYSGMKFTLQYCKENLGKELSDNCLGLIPYYYDEAQVYYRGLQLYQSNIIETMKVLELQENVTVQISPNIRKKKKQFNIEEIGVNEDEEV